MSHASRLPRTRRLVPPVAALALALAGLGAWPASAAPDGSGLVISEVYGGGGNGGATYTNDFVELYNPTDAAISVDDMSVQYRSSSATTSPTGVTAISGSVGPHAHYLVAEAKGAGGTKALPTADATGTIALSASAGTVFLASQTTALSAPPVGSDIGAPGVVDLVGFGATNTYETEPTAAPGNATSVSRSSTGTDTDDNSADLTTGDPGPESSASTGGGGGGGGTGDDPQSVTIAELQGTTDTSPYAGDQVTTEGVVTASYPTGGFAGFYLQTPGTGGDEPASHDASDAVFVYLGNQAAYPRIGDHLQVTGTVSEYFGLTELNAAAGGVTSLSTPAEAVKPVTDAYPSTDSGRESLEGMLFAPGDFTVTDVFTLNQYGEIELAAGSTPLRQPTDVARPGSTAYQQVVADNAARAVILDDGASLNFGSSAQDTPLPWITRDHSIRVGAQPSFTRPVVLDYRNSSWKLEPTSQLTAGNGDEVAPAQFPDTRTAAPAPVAGDLKIASFNVLNFFTETGADYEAAGHSCSSYDDRDGNPITVDDCGADGPRGAWNDVNQQRQQAKIVSAINRLGADVLSLEEIENSAKYDEPVPAGVEPRDVALDQLVDALNADAGSTVWAYVPSPDAADLPPLDEQDVIRTAFIYRVAKARPVGDSHVLVGSPAFANARQPLGQVFEPAGGTSAQEFLAVVNHFKSKGSGSGQDADQGDGQGASNYSRVQQAHALVDFVDTLKSSTGVDRVFLTGDFNSYTQEDPIQVLRDAGYTDLGSADAPTESTYVFDGLVGSLDHVLANDAALPTVQGAHVWNINSVESVAYEYSRYNDNATDFYAPGPYRSSDHDPTLVGFTIPDERAATTVRARVAPGSPRAGHQAHVKVVVTSATGRVVDGQVQVSLGDELLGSGTVRNGRATILITPAQAGSQDLRVDYLGTDDEAPSSTTVTVEVRAGR